jgi:hypothetical protein
MMRALWACALVLCVGCGSSQKPVEEPKPEPEKVVKSDHSGGPAIEYDLGGIDPNTWKKTVEALKPDWMECFKAAHAKHETLEGKLTFTVRTNKDGSVKWAFVKDSDLGSRVVEKCVVDSIKASNFGPPMDAKEGEMQGHTVGWPLDDEARPADPGAQGSVLPSLEKAKGKLDACRKDGKGKMTATLYIAKGGKPISAGVAIDDPSLDPAVDCVVEVLMKLQYVNKASWPTKVTVQLP